MKKFNKILVTTLIALSCFFAANHAMAQGGMSGMRNATPAQRAQLQTNMMKSKLKLDTVQITKVQAINLKYAQKMDPILKSTGSPMDRIQQAMALQTQKDKELQGVFTKEQFKQYSAAEQELKNKMMSRMGNSN